MISGHILFFSLFNNLAIFIVLIAVYGYLNPKLTNQKPVVRQIILGVIFGIFAIGCMNIKIPVARGLIVDQRNTIVILSGIFGGPVSALFSALFTAIYRAYLGGIGVIGGSLGIGLSAVAGIVLHKLRPRIYSIWKAAIAALAATVFILPGFVPIGDFIKGINLMLKMTLPYGSAVFIGLLLLALLLNHQEYSQKVQNALLESEKRYRILFESSVDAIYRLDDQGIITVISPAIEKMSGYTAAEISGRPVADLLKEKSLVRDLIGRLKKEVNVENYETEIIKKDGSPAWISSNAKALIDSNGVFAGVEGVARNISVLKRMEAEKAQLEERLRQGQKMESIGTLAGGIAHDFNNILSVIIGYAEITLQVPEDPDILKENIERILEAGMRARELVKHILLLSRKSPHKPLPLQLETLLQEAMRMLRAIIPTTINIQLKLHATGKMIYADPTEIEQVIMNLCMNATHAMEENGGILKLDLESIELEKKDLLDEPSSTPGSYLVLTVSDTGHGIHPENLTRIFDPYFTTKEMGKGSGMGLSVVHGIVKKLNGIIRVESTPGYGSRFMVYFPEYKGGECFLSRDSFWQREEKNIFCW